MLSSLSDADRLAYLPTYIHSLLRAAMLNDAVFQEANDWSCCAIWMLPGKRVDNPFTMLQAGLFGVLWNIGLGGCKRMLIDFEKQSDACKRKGLRDLDGIPLKKYHYLFFIATDFHARGKGIASKVVSRYREKAVEDGLPIWLEATTPKSRDIYIHQGFNVVQEMRLGEGSHAETGDVEKGGAGVPVWAMIWHPRRDNTNRQGLGKVAE